MMRALVLAAAALLVATPIADAKPKTKAVRFAASRAACFDRRGWWRFAPASAAGAATTSAATRTSAARLT